MFKFKVNQLLGEHLLQANYGHLCMSWVLRENKDVIECTSHTLQTRDKYIGQSWFKCLAFDIHGIKNPRLANIYINHVVKNSLPDKWT